MLRISPLTATYIYLAVGSCAIGFVLVVAVVIGANYIGIDVSRNIWVLAIPLFLALLINVTMIELYNRFWKR